MSKQAKPPWMAEGVWSEWELLPPYTIIEEGDRAWAWDWLWGVESRDKMPPAEIDKWHHYEAGNKVIGLVSSPQDIHVRRRKKS